MFGFEGDNAREKLIVLFTMSLALAMAMLDNTVVNVALPTISRELGAGVSGPSGSSTATCCCSPRSCSPAGSSA